MLVTAVGRATRPRPGHRAPRPSTRPPSCLRRATCHGCSGLARWNIISGRHNRQSGASQLDPRYFQPLAGRKERIVRSKTFSRRKFIAAGAVSSLAFSVVPRRVLGAPGVSPPSGRLNVGCIGIGGQGGGVTRELASFENVNIAARIRVFQSSTPIAAPNARNNRSHHLQCLRTTEGSTFSRSFAPSRIF